MSPVADRQATSCGLKAGTSSVFGKEIVVVF
jgi:hypothetical protein